jgi:hypothetical protein
MQNREITSGRPAAVGVARRAIQVRCRQHRGARAGMNGGVPGSRDPGALTQLKTSSAVAGKRADFRQFRKVARRTFRLTDFGSQPRGP